MSEDEIRIRLAEERIAFIYSILRAGMLIETAVVPPTDEASDDFVASEYYGGSQVMD